MLACVTVRFAICVSSLVPTSIATTATVANTQSTVAYLLIPAQPATTAYEVRSPEVSHCSVIVCATPC